MHTHGRVWREGVGGLIMLVYSCVLTRGTSVTRGDMDGEGSTLIGAHGYCTAEMVHLMLLGRAVSNVFDGDRDLSEGLSDTYLTPIETY